MGIFDQTKGKKTHSFAAFVSLPGILMLLQNPELNAFFESLMGPWFQPYTLIVGVAISLLRILTNKSFQ